MRYANADGDFCNGSTASTGKRRCYVGFTAGTGRIARDAQLEFHNMRAQLWWQFREALDPAQGEGVALPPDRRLAAPRRAHLEAARQRDPDREQGRDPQAARHIDRRCRRRRARLPQARGRAASADARAAAQSGDCARRPGRMDRELMRVARPECNASRVGLAAVPGFRKRSTRATGPAMRAVRPPIGPRTYRTIPGRARTRRLDSATGARSRRRAARPPTT